METYRKIFFWVFVILGIAWAVDNQEFINSLFYELDLFFGEFFSEDRIQGDWYKRGPLILTPLMLILVLIFYGLILVFIIIYFVFKYILLALSKIYVGYALIGIIFIYPFYVIFINLFELFLLLMIRHPSRTDIRRVIGRRRIDEDTIATISEKMMAFSGEITHELESQIMTRQLKGLSRMIHAEAAFIRQMRENRIREAMRSFERL